MFRKVSLILMLLITLLVLFSCRILFPISSIDTTETKLDFETEVSIEVLETTIDSISYIISVDDSIPLGYFLKYKIILLLDGEEVEKKEYETGNNSVSLHQNLLSNTEYLVRVEVEFQGKKFQNEKVIKTLARDLPIINIDNINTDNSNLIFDLSYIDKDNVIEKLEVILLKDEKIIQIQEIELVKHEKDNEVIKNIHFYDLDIDTVYEIKYLATLNFQDGNKTQSMEKSEFVVVNPIYISNINDLKMIYNRPKAHYVLLNNINFLGEEWIPIDNFSGSINGNGFTIHNFMINKGNSFINKNSGKIFNLGIDKFSIKKMDTTDNIYYGTIAGINEGSIINSYASGKINVTSNNSFNVGGLVGVNQGEITNSYAYVDIISSSDNDIFCGGLVGENSGKIINSYATGNINTNANNFNYSGGLVGINEGEILNSYAIGNVYVSSENNPSAGALVAYNNNNLINNSYIFTSQIIKENEVETEPIDKNYEGINLVTSKELMNKEFFLNNLKWQEGEWFFYLEDDALIYPIINNIFEDEGFYFRLTINDEYEILKYLDNEEVVTIPESFNGKYITLLGNNVFINQNEIKIINLSSKIKYIGKEVFKNMTKLEAINVEISNNYYSSIDGVLFNKQKNQLIKYPEGKKTAFYEIPDTVNDIADYAFYKALVNEVVINYHINLKIGKMVFFKADNITTLTIPGNYQLSYLFGDEIPLSLKTVKVAEGSKYVVSNAFSNIKSLENFYLPDSITNIGEAILTGTNIVNITMPGNYQLKYFFGDDINNVPKTIKNVTITKGTKEIVAYAFSDISSIENIYLPVGLETIKEGAFSNLENLSSLEIPSSVSSIERNILLGTNLKSLKYSCDKTLGYLFGEIPLSLETLIINEGTKEIVSNAFNGAKSVKEINLPSSVVIIGNTAFSNMDSLEMIFVDENNPSFTSLDGILFDKDLQTLIKYPEQKQDAYYKIPRDVCIIKDEAFMNNLYLKEIVISYIQDANRVLFGVNNLEKITYEGTISLRILFGYDIPSTLKEIELTNNYNIKSGALYGANNLEILTMPSNISLGYLFGSNIPESLKTVRINNLSSSITYETFRGALHVEEINISSVITRIDQDAFNDMISLKQINVDDKNQIFASLDGVLFNKSITELIKYPRQKESTYYKVPLTVTSIKDEAFINVEKLTKLVFHNGIVNIGNRVLYNTNITELTISNHFTLKYLFSNIIPSSLETINICEGTREVNVSLFVGANIKEINLSSTVSYIDINTFDNLPLISINVSLDNNTYSSIDGILFNKTQTILLKYPQNKSNSLYEIPEYVTSIGDSAFKGVNYLKEIILSDYLVIGTNALLGTKLEKITYSGNYTLNYLFGGNIPTSLKCVVLVNEGVENALTNANIEELTMPGNLTLGFLFGKNIPNSLKKVNISTSSTYITAYAFKDALGLEEINIPNSVNLIEYNAFSNLPNLKTINVALDNEMFTTVDGILFNKDMSILIKYPINKTNRDYVIPNSVTEISKEAFKDAIYLEEIIIPLSVSEIGNDILNGANNIVNITYSGNYSLRHIFGENIPSSLTTININEGSLNIVEQAFTGASGVEEVYISSTVCYIGDNAFSNMEKLLKINVAIDNIYYSSLDGVLFNKDMTELIKYPMKKTDKYYHLPDTVIKIHSEAFKGAINLEEIYLSASVNKIGSDILSGVNNLTMLSYPGNYPLSYLFGINIPSSLKTINISSGATDIVEKAFSNASFVERIEIPRSVNSIGADAFTNMIYLKYINVDNNNNYYQSINGVLFNKEGTVLIKYPNNLYEFSYTIPDTVTRIEDNAFYLNHYLKTVIIHENVREIGENAFSYSQIENLSYPSKFTLSDLYGDIGLNSLKIINITSGTTILENAFVGGNNIEEIYLPDSVTSIKAGAFKYLKSLKKIIVASNNPYYCSSNEILFNKDLTNLIAYPANKTLDVYNIPSSVTKIESYAFYQANINKITIPNTVLSIGDLAFANSYLTEIVIPSSVNSLGETILNNTTNLRKITMPGKFRLSLLRDVTLPLETIILKGSVEIVESALQGANVEKIDIQEGVKIIGTNAFRNSLVKLIYLPLSIETINSGAFYNTTNIETIHLPGHIKLDQLYSTINQPQNLTTIHYQIGSTEIVATSLAGFSNITTITIPNTVTTIGNGAFRNTSITSIELKENLSIVGAYAFANTNITSITLPSTVVEIGEYAFNNCSNLTVINVKAITPPVITYLVSNTNNLRIYVPTRWYAIYCSDPNWQKYKSILWFEDF